MNSVKTQPLSPDWAFDNLEAVRSLQALNSLGTLKVQPPPAVPADINAMDGNVVLLTMAAVLVLLSVVTYVSTGSVLATGVVLTMVLGFLMILGLMGIIKIYFDKDGRIHIEYHHINGGPTPNLPGTPGVQRVNLFEWLFGKEDKAVEDVAKGLVKGAGDLARHGDIPAPSGAKGKSGVPKPVVRSEVFHVGGNQYTYDEAPAVCAAYDSELANYDQVSRALASGAEWCAYGWTQGGMALYPTQQATWDGLQKEPRTRTACGRPGINGGYFDTNTKFGVNCYGPKPPNKKGVKLPQPLPGMDPLAYQSLVDRFKKMMNSMSVNPYNRTEWSEWNKSGNPSPQ
jgi:hypothetical protein